MSTKELREAIRRFRKPPAEDVDLSPKSPFDALLDERLKGLERQVAELKNRVNGLLFLVMGAVIVQVVLGFFQ